MTEKTQNILHWILVVALTLTAVEPSVKQIIPNGADAILAVILGVATKFICRGTDDSGAFIYEEDSGPA